MDMISVISGLLYHILISFYNKNRFEYYTLTSCGLTLYQISYLLQYKGYTDYAMACHVILHILAVASNMTLYFGIHR